MERPRHPIFADRPEDRAKLWRYLSFAKLASLLQSSSLHFTRVDKFDDHFEGAWPKSDLEYLLNLKGFSVPNFTEQMKRKCVAASCWVGLPHESAAMWRLYAPGGESVAITTTFGKLNAVVEAANSLELVNLAGAGRVHYFDHVSKGLIDPLGPDDPLPNTLQPFMLKNISYEHEKEVRGLLVAPLGHAEIEPVGCDLPIELSSFVDDIVVSPNAPKWFFDAVSGLVHRYGLIEKVKPSALSRDMFYMRVESQPKQRAQGDTPVEEGTS